MEMHGIKVSRKADLETLLTHFLISMRCILSKSSRWTPVAPLTRVVIKVSCEADFETVLLRMQDMGYAQHLTVRESRLDTDVPVHDMSLVCVISSHVHNAKPVLLHPSSLPPTWSATLTSGAPFSRVQMQDMEMRHHDEMHLHMERAEEKANEIIHSDKFSTAKTLIADYGFDIDDVERALLIGRY